MEDSSTVAALAAVGGSLVGGLSSFLTSYFSQRHQGRHERTNRELDRREALYGQFIDHSAALFMDSLDKTLEKPAQLVELVALVGRIRLSAEQEVIDATEAILMDLIASYQRPAVDPGDMLAYTRENFHASLLVFTEACRRERDRLLARV